MDLHPNYSGIQGIFFRIWLKCQKPNCKAEPQIIDSYFQDAVENPALLFCSIMDRITLKQAAISGK